MPPCSVYWHTCALLSTSAYACARTPRSLLRCTLTPAGRSGSLLWEVSCWRTGDWYTGGAGCNALYLTRLLRPITLLRPSPHVRPPMCVPCASTSRSTYRGRPPSAWTPSPRSTWPTTRWPSRKPNTSCASPTTYATLWPAVSTSRSMYPRPSNLPTSSPKRCPACPLHGCATRSYPAPEGWALAPRHPCDLVGKWANPQNYMITLSYPIELNSGAVPRRADAC
mmetsp:Transcript_35184/g.79810  ORF Transcript_35184/g.79810 Transcript_35184/m.79810 type:complete len:224 (+) Transcript_35184:830-1501(+)